MERLNDYMPEDEVIITANGKINGYDVMTLSNGD